MTAQEITYSTPITISLLGGPAAVVLGLILAYDLGQRLAMTVDFLFFRRGTL